MTSLTYLLSAYALGEGRRSLSSNGIRSGTTPSVRSPVAISLEA